MVLSAQTAKSILEYQNLGKDYRMAALYNNMSALERDMEKYAEAEEMALRSLEIIMTMPQYRIEMATSLINLGETFVLTRNKYGKWWISLIVSIVTIAAGIFLVRNAFNLASLITRIAGGILVFDGISDLWVVSRLSKSASLKEEAAAFSGASVFSVSAA